MFKRFFSLFSKFIPNSKPEPQLDPGVFVSFSNFGDEQVIITVDTSEDEIDPYMLAGVVSYICSARCELDIIDIVGRGLQDRQDLYESFVGHLLDIKTKEIKLSESDPEGGISPCIGPLEML